MLFFHVINQKDGAMMDCGGLRILAGRPVIQDKILSFYLLSCQHCQIIDIA